MWADKQILQQQSTSSNSGNAFFRRQAVQPKLQINDPGDSYEKQADAMADRVMRMPHPSLNDTAFFKPSVDAIQRKTHQCEDDDLHRKENSDSPVNGSSQLDSYVGSLGSSGQPLPASSRQFFEPRFGQDFSNVRIHTDTVAAKSAQSINALAYTTGNNIVFNQGQYSPESESGKKLMAHELTHVMQQSDNIQPYRPKDSFNFGKGDTDTLKEDSMLFANEKETKPWIESITVVLDKQKEDADKHHVWIGTGVAKYYKDKMPAINFDVAAGSPEVGMTSKGTFTVYGIEGLGYNSGTHSGAVDPATREGPSKLYSKDTNFANMHYAVYYFNGEALHIGALDTSSHGCIHVGNDHMQQINYHSVRVHTIVKVSYV
jgi:hypothetical protein